MTAADTQGRRSTGPRTACPEKTGRSPPDRKPPGRRPKRRRKKGELLPYLLILPAILAIAAVYVYPLIKTVIMSFQDLGGAALWGNGETPVGRLRAVHQHPRRPRVLAVVGRTVVFMTVCVVLPWASAC